MKIPQERQVLEIKRNDGERREAIVHSVSPIQPGIHRLWLQVVREIERGEHLRLVTEESEFPLAVHQTQQGDGFLLIELRAYDGAVPPAS